MKKVLAILIASMMSLSASATVVGKVDIQKVLLTIKQGQSVRDKLKKSFEKKQKVLKGEEAKIRKDQEAFKKQSLVMNAASKSKKENAIKEQIMKLQQKSQQFQRDIQQMENKLKRPILERVKKIITKISKKSNVDLTFESSTAPVIYAKSEKDLTAEVIKAYDKEYKK